MGMTVPVLDLRAIRAQILLFNTIANQLGGHLAIRSRGVDPTSVERGRPQPLPPIEHDFPEGAVGPATDLVLRLNRQPGRNVTLPAVNGFIQRLTANCSFVRAKHTNIGNRLVGGVIGDVREEEDEPPELADEDLPDQDLH
jgi:hypothetical protein